MRDSGGGFAAGGGAYRTAAAAGSDRISSRFDRVGCKRAAGGERMLQ
jgi:hypothetical protein